MVKDEPERLYVPPKLLQPVDPESLPPAANTRVPAEGAVVAFVIAPVVEAYAVSCQVVPTSETGFGADVATALLIDGAGLVVNGVVTGAAEELSEFDASELHPDARSPARVNGTATNRYRRLCIHIGSAYVSTGAIQGLAATQRCDWNQVVTEPRALSSPGSVSSEL